MADLRWLDLDRGIILWTFHASDLAESAADPFKRLHPMIEQITPNTYLIVDFLEFRSIQANALNTIPHLARNAPHGAKSPQVIAVVSDKPIIASLAEAFWRFYTSYHSRIMNFPTVEEARQFIKVRYAVHAA